MKKRIIGLFSLVFALILLVSCGDKTFKVAFDLKGGTGEIEDLKVEEGSLIDIPTQPTKDGYIFDFWMNEETEEKWNFSEDKVTKNITLVAVWKEPEAIYYNVKFFALQGTPEPEDQEVLENGKVTKPVDPTREDYRFLGWYLPDSTEVYDFNLPVTSDLIISAKWEKIIYVTVTYNLDGGTPLIDDVKLEKGKKVTEPEEPEKEGYEFIGWFVGSVEFDFDLPINENVTIKAKWEKIIVSYEVTFDLVYDIETFSENVLEGETVTEPDNPVRDGYKFVGWYLEEEVFDFNSPIEDNLTLKAVWQKEHTVIFYLDEELTEEYESEIVLDGNKVLKPTEPEKVGYSFVGWFVEDEEFDFDSEVKDDLNIVAKWKTEYVVAFYLEEDDSNVYVQFIINEGETVSEPAEPAKDFFIFLGWYLEEEEFDFETPITKSLTIIAKWADEGFVPRAYIGDKEYQSINLAVEDAIDGDIILLADEVHDMDVLVNVNNLTFKPKNPEDEVVITAKFTLVGGLNGVTFDGLYFTDNAQIHAPGVIDNVVFINNKVYDLTIEPSGFLPANRVDVNAFIRFYTIEGTNIVGNVTITDNEFSDIKSDIISLARTSIGKAIILKDNLFTNIEMSAIRFDGGYNNGTYTIEGNKFANDEDVPNTAVIVFRAYSSSQGNKQIIDIIDNEFINVGSTEYPIADTHPGSGVITFSTYNEYETIITIENNVFNNPSNAVHLRDNRGNNTNLSFTLQNNTFIDGAGFILYESNYRETDPNIVLGENTYIIDDEEVEVEDIIERIRRETN